jgi:hypothetical protein
MCLAATAITATTKTLKSDENAKSDSEIHPHRSEDDEAGGRRLGVVCCSVRSRKTGVVWKRRYALLGWLVWKYWKRGARSKLPRR